MNETQRKHNMTDKELTELENKFLAILACETETVIVDLFYNILRETDDYIMTIKQVITIKRGINK